MAHKHWAKDHPYYERAPECKLTKKDCDVLWTQYLHFHEGEPCQKVVLPGNKNATCVLTYDEAKLKRRLSKAVKHQDE